jgi:TolB-like protein
LSSSLPPARLARFDSLQLDVSAGELTVGARKIRLQQQPFQLLVALVENPGAVISRDEIRKKLWPSDTTVEFDHGIDTVIKKLRQALGDNAANPRYIETLPRRGYRWLTEVTWAELTNAPVRPAAEQRRPRKESQPGRDDTIDSIAVLPFSTLSADSESDYFGDGLAEDIINALTGVPDLNVTARTSAFAFRGKNQDVRRIGEALGVRAILEGSIRRDGNRLRVTVQLINALDGYHLWSEQYDRDIADVFAVQEEIARAIVERLNRQFAAGKLVVRRTTNIESYDAFLKGRHSFSKLTPETIIRAAAFFEEAIALDPDDAPAYSGLARCFFALAQFGVKPASELMPQARATALRAVQLNEMDSEAHAILGQVAGAFEYDWKEALRRYRLALACKPVSLMAQHWCAQFILIPLRRFDEAIAIIEPLLIADPCALFLRKALADALAWRGDNDRAIEELRRIVELDDAFWLAHFALGNIYSAQGRIPEAIDAYEKALQTASFPPLIGSLAAAYARAGDSMRAEGILARLSASGESDSRAKALMFYYFACSEFDRGADYLEKLITARDPDLIWLGCNPVLARESPRVRALLESINLADKPPDMRAGRA